jgi:hypothetical protein
VTDFVSELFDVIAMRPHSDRYYGIRQFAIGVTENQQHLTGMWIAANDPNRFTDLSYRYVPNIAKYIRGWWVRENETKVAEIVRNAKAR